MVMVLTSGNLYFFVIINIHVLRFCSIKDKILLEIVYACQLMSTKDKSGN